MNQEMKVLYYFLYKILIKSRREEDPGGAIAIMLGFMVFLEYYNSIEDEFSFRLFLYA